MSPEAAVAGRIRSRSGHEALIGAAPELREFIDVLGIFTQQGGLATFDLSDHKERLLEVLDGSFEVGHCGASGAFELLNTRFKIVMARSTSCSVMI